MEGDLPNLGACVIAFRRVRCEVKTARGFPKYRVGASWHGRRKGGGVECGLVKKKLVDAARETPAPRAMAAVRTRRTTTPHSTTRGLTVANVTHRRSFIVSRAP